MYKATVKNALELSCTITRVKVFVWMALFKYSMAMRRSTEKGLEVVITWTCNG